MNLKKFAPHITAILLFALITLIQFSPIYSGKVINQSDITQFRGMSKEITDFRDTEHREPLWTNSMFGGMPAYQISTLYPGNWLNSIDRVFHLFMPGQSGYVFMYFFGFFILLLCLDINPWMALAGSLAYGFSSYFFIILEVGHNSKANAIGYLAPLLGGILLLMRGKPWMGFALSTLFMALELNANHIQITYYGFMLYSLVFLAYFITALRQKNLKQFLTGAGLFAASCAAGILPNAGSLLCTYEYGDYTTRGKTELSIDPSLKTNASNKTSGLDKDYATQWSYGIGETFTFLIPNFKGGGSNAIMNTDKNALADLDPQMKEQVGYESAYFGDQGSTSGPVYIGAIVMLLAFLGLFIVDHPIKWALVGTTVITVMLSWGHNLMGFTSFFMDHFPGYNKFRSVTIILIVAELTLPLLAILALDKLFRLSGENRTLQFPLLKTPVTLKKILYVSVAVAGGFCLLCILSPTSMNTFSPAQEEVQIASQFRQGGMSDEQIAQAMPAFTSNLEKARIALFKSDAWRSLIFIVLASGLLLLVLNNKLKQTYAIAGLGLLFMADLWPVADRYLNSKNFVSKSLFEAPPAKTAADEQILQDQSLDYRVLNLSVSPFMDATTSYYHKSVGGYHGAKLKKYDELMYFHLKKEISTFSSGMSSVRNDSSLNLLMSRLGVFNMLNTKYIIIPTKDGTAALQNPQTNGNAWFVKSLRTVADADSEMVGLYHLSTRNVALIQAKNKARAPLSDSYAGEGTISLQSYKPNDLVYASDTREKEFAVFSEIYYPKGWNVFLDEKPIPYYCVDYLLRGMEVPAGKHRIEFKFEPTIYKTGNNISLAGSVLVLLCVGAGVFVSVRKKEVSL